jgi:hypothetical protein
VRSVKEQGDGDGPARVSRALETLHRQDEVGGLESYINKFNSNQRVQTPMRTKLCLHKNRRTQPLISESTNRYAQKSMM